MVDAFRMVVGTCLTDRR